MLSRPVLRRPLPPRLPRRLAATVAALVAVPGLALLATAPAHAALSSPTADSTASGVVAVREANGASNNCVAGQGSPYTRFQVTRADGTVVGSDQQSGTGAKTYSWSSVGQPRGAYVARSWTRSAQKSGFLNLGCTNRSEEAQPPVSFTVDNHAAVALSLPATAVTGEDLTVGVQTSIVGTGVTGSWLASLGQEAGQALAEKRAAKPQPEPQLQPQLTQTAGPIREVLLTEPIPQPATQGAGPRFVPAAPL